MLQFRLNSLDQRVWITASARTRVRFVHGLLCRDHELEPIAQLHDQMWVHDKQGFDEVAFEHAVLVIFHAKNGDRSPSYGPFQNFHTEDGHAYADGRPFALFDESAGAWRDEMGALWRTMTIVEALPEDATGARMQR